MSLLGILATAILPVVAVATAGFALGRAKDTDPDALNTITVYVLAPALVVHSLTTSSLAGSTIVDVVLVVVLFTAAMIALAESIARSTGHSEPLLGAFVLASVFPNTGNYGIPLADFAFGATGRSTAVLVTALQGVMLYTVGIYIAARGREGSPLADMRRVFGVPLVYAVVVALAARWLGVVPPADSTLMQTLELLGNASIPVMLLILGIQLSNVDGDGDVRPIGTASAMRLLVAPLLAIAVVLAVGVGDATVSRVLVVLLATPTGVTTIILIGAFSQDVDGLSAEEFISATVFLTTIASIVTVTALIAVLQSGFFI